MARGEVFQQVTMSLGRSNASVSFRLNAGAAHVAVSVTIGPELGAMFPRSKMMVVARLDTKLKTAGTFYTDSNGKFTSSRV